MWRRKVGQQISYEVWIGFSPTAQNLSGEAIVDFVKALVQVSWQEIQSSGQSESPRTYSLQKLVEISGYNMTRVRFEWTNIWQVLGAHFNDVGCHTNTNVVFFALNSLRQLSMKFMEIEELPGFKFQKDFLKPFEHIINNASVVSVKDMVLRCLIQMIQGSGPEHSIWLGKPCLVFSRWLPESRTVSVTIHSLLAAQSLTLHRGHRQSCL